MESTSEELGEKQKGLLRQRRGMKTRRTQQGLAGLE